MSLESIGCNYGQWNRRMETRNVYKWPVDLGKLKVEKQILKSVFTAWLLYFLRVNIMPGSFGPAYLEPISLLFIFARASDHIRPFMCVRLPIRLLCIRPHQDSYCPHVAKCIVGHSI